MTMAFVMNEHVNAAFDQRSVEPMNATYDALALTA